MTTYSERLTAPLSWWVSALVFGGVCGWLVLVPTTWPIGLTVAAVTAAFGLVAVWRYGTVDITAGPDGLRAGRATLEPVNVGTAEVLDHASYRHRLGAGADARGHLVTRPYLDRGVLVHVEDDTDPTPYWVISSRHPLSLAAALNDTTETDHAPRKATRGEES